MEIYEFWKKISDVKFYGSNWQLHSIGSDNGLELSSRQTTDGLVWRCIHVYVSLGLNELYTETNAKLEPLLLIRIC